MIVDVCTEYIYSKSEEQEYMLSALDLYSYTNL